MKLNKNHCHIIRMVLRGAGITGEKTEEVLGYIGCEDCTRAKLEKALITHIDVKKGLAKRLSETLLPT